MLTARQARPLLSTLFASFDATSTTPPKAVADAHARLLRASQAFAEIPIPQRDALPVAVLAALEAKRDPADDPAVQRILASHTLASRHDLEHELAGIIYEDLHGCLGDHADAIVGVWNKPFTAAAKAIGEAHAELGRVALDDTATIVRRGPTATAAWTSATAAVHAIDTIDNGWASLHALLHGGTRPDKAQALLRISPVTPAQWLDGPLAELAPDPWAATLEGIPLALPTLGEYRARVQAIDAERHARDAQAAQAASDRMTGRMTTRRATIV